MFEADVILDCEPCSLYICAHCWTHGQRCKAEMHHQPSYKKDTTPASCCRRLKKRESVLNCDKCGQACRGLHFRKSISVQVDFVCFVLYFYVLEFSRKSDQFCATESYERRLKTIQIAVIVSMIILISV